MLVTNYQSQYHNPEDSTIQQEWVKPQIMHYKMCPTFFSVQPPIAKFKYNMYKGFEMKHIYEVC